MVAHDAPDAAPEHAPDRGPDACPRLSALAAPQRGTDPRADLRTDTTAHPSAPRRVIRADGPSLGAAYAGPDLGHLLTLDLRNAWLGRVAHIQVGSLA